MRNSHRIKWRWLGLVILALVGMVRHEAWAQRYEPDSMVPSPYRVTYAPARDAWGMQTSHAFPLGGGVPTVPISLGHSLYPVPLPRQVPFTGIPFPIDPTPPSIFPVIPRSDIPFPAGPSELFGTYPYTRGSSLMGPGPGIYMPALIIPSIIPVQPPRPSCYASRAQLP